MWPFSRTVPEIGHESCSKKIGTLAERVTQLELASAERNLQVLELAEKVAEKLKDRVRHREAVPTAPTRPPRPWELSKRNGGG
jgi:hypothetical protein